MNERVAQGIGVVVVTVVVIGFLRLAWDNAGFLLFAGVAVAAGYWLYMNTDK